MELKKVSTKEVFEFATGNFFYKIDKEDNKCILKRKQNESYSWGHGVAVEGVDVDNTFMPQAIINKHKIFASPEDAQKFALEQENVMASAPKI